MLPVDGSALAVPPTMAASLAFRSAIVLTSPEPVPNVNVSAGLAPILKVIVCPAAAALCVSRLVALVVPADRPSSPSSESVLEPPMVMLVSASPLVSTSLPLEATDAVTLVVAVWALISAWMAVMSSPAVMVIGVPLIDNVPPADDRAVSEADPVSFAAASPASTAPLPMIFAAAGAPTTGLAEKFAWLSSSDPGILLL